MKNRLIISFILCILMPFSVHADEKADFETAITQWLAGEEETPLITLSRLANDGYVDAQILLAQIERSSSFTSDFVLGLTRKERITLLRNPVGLSGKSWLEASAETSELAAALIASKSAETRMAALINLYELGENRIADDAFIAQLNYGYEEIFEVASQRSLTPSMVPNVTMLADILPEVGLELVKGLPDYILLMKERGNYRELTSAEAQDALFQLSPYFYKIVTEHPDYPDFLFGRVVAEIGASPVQIAQFDTWIMTHPMIDVLRSPCERVCPNDATACTRAAYYGIPLRETMALGSPVENIISHTRYIESERAVLDMVSGWVNRVTDERDIPDASACFAELVETERAKRN